jgi:eukaryotic-like serine/threonine-protein kinase
MTLAPGTRLGPYEIVSPLGAGGMGEVWRAKDTRLGRVVAIKVLPEEFFEDEERRHRFEREARTLASLSHPGIAAIHSFEEVPGSVPSSTRHLLVMELVEGEDLAQRLLSGPLPLDEALPVARQIAEALEAAHEKGIVHRDLKPANVKVTPDGRVKLLDFGLAKAFEAEAGSGPALTQSPTLTARATAAGVILGTAAYMSPEQARGKVVDKRTDIWAFGCVLYEMLSGRQAFGKETVGDTFAAILTKEPDWSALRAPGVSSKVVELLRRCLQREAKQRLRDVGDARIALEEEIGAAGSSSGQLPFEGIQADPNSTVGRSVPASRERVSRKSLALPWMIAAASAAVAGALAILSLRHRAPDAASELLRFKILAPPGQSLFGFAVLSPDARRLLMVFRDDGGRNRLAIRSLDSLEVRILPGTEDTRGAFWSPDGSDVGFFAEGKLKRMSADGGPSRAVCEAGGAVWGAWSPEGTILFATHFGGPLYAVPAAGGTLTQATTLDATAGEEHQSQPCLLPDGRHYVYFSANADFSKRSIRLGSLGSKETRPLFESDSSAVYADGHLIFARDDAVLAWRFDPKSLRLVGEPFPAFEHVHWRMGDNYLSLSAAGRRVAYVSWALKRQLVWVDRKGREIGTLGEIAGFADVRISPDGRKVAVATRGPAHGGNADIWVLDAARGTPERVTSGPNDDFNPAWFPDGRRLAYVSDRFGWYNVFERPASGGPETLLIRSEQDKAFPSVLPDGRRLLLDAIETPRYVRLVMPLDDPKSVVRLSGDSPFSEEHPALSADGRWTAFDSLESGQREVYVQPLAGGPKRQVSVGGGQMPVWSRNGRELFYAARNGVLMSVALRPEGGRLDAGEPQPLFPLQFDLSGELTWHLRPFDVTPDGERFLVIRRAPGVEPDGIVVVDNWTATLRGVK